MKKSLPNSFSPKESKGKILLVFAPSIGFMESFRTSLKIYVPPLGLQYLASVLTQAGFTVQVIDFNVMQYSFKKLEELIYDKVLVGISVTVMNKEPTQKIISDIREIRKDLPIMLGGPECTIHPTLTRGADVTVIGDAEHKILDIVNALIHKEDLSRLQGIVYLDKGKIIQNKEKKFLKDLDSIPFPLRRGAKAGKSNQAESDPKLKIASIIASRGCPYKCKFCSRGPYSYRTYRQRSVANVLSEVQIIHQTGYKYLWFVDDDFFLNKKRVRQILEGIIQKKYKFRLIIQGRVNNVDAELYKLMKAAGVLLILYGLESANQDSLDFYQKETTVEQNRMAIELADKYGIFTLAYFILGAPMETMAHIQRTIRFSKEIPLDLAVFYPYRISYGSPAWQEAFRKGIVAKEDTMVLATKEKGLGFLSRDEMKKVCEDAYQEFFNRSSHWFRICKKVLKANDIILFTTFFNILLGTLKEKVSRENTNPFSKVKGKKKLWQKVVGHYIDTISTIPD